MRNKNSERYKMAFCFDNPVLYLAAMIAAYAGVVGLTFLFFELRDWWLYSPKANRLRCRMLGHDYHDGVAQGLIVQTPDGPYTYDFCQRCHTEQNRRKVNQ
jgi:hypothetical protein